MQMWKLFWQLAQIGNRYQLLPLVDLSCKLVLSLRPEFWFARELPKHARGYFAQNNQDVMIELFFEKHSPRSKVFIEVGAFDGVHYSNVRRLFEHHGWSGICIEPVLQNFEKLAHSYKGSSVKCMRCAVGNKAGEAVMHVSQYPHLPDWGSDVATMNNENLAYWSKYAPVWREEIVPIRTLNDILDDVGIREFSLLSIDTEGNDLAVLQGIDFDRFQPQLILAEYGDSKKEIYELLSANGYAMFLDNGIDLIFHHNSIAANE